jgi:hypothetical protein
MIRVRRPLAENWLKWESYRRPARLRTPARPPARPPARLRARPPARAARARRPRAPPARAAYVEPYAEEAMGADEAAEEGTPTVL